MLSCAHFMAPCSRGVWSDLPASAASSGLGNLSKPQPSCQVTPEPAMPACAHGNSSLCQAAVPAAQLQLWCDAPSSAGAVPDIDQPFVLSCEGAAGWGYSPPGWR